MLDLARFCQAAVQGRHCLQRHRTHSRVGWVQQTLLGAGAVVHAVGLITSSSLAGYCMGKLRACWPQLLGNVLPRMLAAQWRDKSSEMYTAGIC